ncbi:MAG: orotate phosphoribosyltransferase [Cyclobacteriaceae bacterium]
MSEIKIVSQVAETVAGMLLEIGAIKLDPNQPFTWASGWQSPIYCDNRLALSFPKTRSYIKEILSQEIKQHFPGVEAVAGVATAGIPQGALVADALDLPFIYVRSKPKGHGMENLIEGKVVPQQKVVVIEDLISTGGSSLKAVYALQSAGFQVLGLAAIFSYGFQLADKNFQQDQIRWFSLSNYEALIRQALAKNYIQDDQLELLQSWRHSPDEWPTV